MALFDLPIAIRMNFQSNMTLIDFSPEINFKTTRSGGKGGQNVNKVETAVIGSLHIGTSQLLTEDQIQTLTQKLNKRITSEGFLQVKSQTYRTQLQNKKEVTRKINELVHAALKKKKKRIATKVSKALKEKRLESKKRKAELKSTRKKYNP